MQVASETQSPITTKGQLILRTLPSSALCRISSDLSESASDGNPKRNERKQLKAGITTRRWIKTIVRVCFWPTGCWGRPQLEFYILLLASHFNRRSEGRIMFWHKYLQSAGATAVSRAFMRCPALEQLSPPDSWDAAGTPSWSFPTYAPIRKTPWLIIPPLQRQWRRADLHHGVWTHQPDWMIYWLCYIQWCAHLKQLSIGSSAQVINLRTYVSLEGLTIMMWLE